MLRLGSKVLVINRLNNQSMNYGKIVARDKAKELLIVEMDEGGRTLECTEVWPIRDRQCYVAVPAE